MADGWSGPDPIAFIDPGADYELGTKYHTNADISIDHIRVWQGPGGTAQLNRHARVWNAGGVELANAVLPDVLPVGWSSYALNVAVQITTGNDVWVSYTVNETYGAVAPGGYPRTSTDTLVTATAGGLNNVPTLFPGTGPNTAFYGIDIQYVASGNVPPIAGLTVTATSTSLQAQAVLTVVDEVPATCTFVVEWGDGQTTTVLGPQTLTHTYASTGTYAVLVTVTDALGLSDSAASAVTVFATAIPGPPIVWAPSTVNSILTGLLTAVSGTLALTTGGRPRRVVFAPGEVAWDECDCGQLAVDVTRRYRSRGFPTDATDALIGNCDEVMIIFDCTISMVRCIPIPDVNGKAPSPTALGRSALIMEEDAYALWNATWCYMSRLRDNTPRLISDFIINDDVSLGPSGACAGSELHFKFGMYVPCGCG